MSVTSTLVVVCLDALKGKIFSSIYLFLQILCLEDVRQKLVNKFQESGKKIVNIR